VEFFGPLLGVMRASHLDHAIELVNQTGYGLTSGIETLDPREQDRWQERVMAGNLYINRGTTGAVTLRQPFGGMGKSALGAGFKAGGPDYVAQFMQFEEEHFPAVGPVDSASALSDVVHRWQLKLDQNEFGEHGPDIRKTIAAIRSYRCHYRKYFSRRNDFFHLPGQDNQLRYLPLGRIVVRLHPGDSLFETLARVAAVKVTGNHLWVSVPKRLRNGVTRFLDGSEGRRFLGDSPVYHEADAGLIESIPTIDRIRYAAPSRVASTVFAAAAETGFYISREPVLMEGRIELLQYLRQQSICNEYHRYGNLGDRARGE
jgi:RHH-type proline utilization regulon transcriptional repressor/proline dehydrogenase/delta 1-pyrroline-5-carboxylate dehydrogenase